MKLLWLCNMMPGKIKEKISGKATSGGLWVDHVLSDLRELDMEVRILCPGDGISGELDGKCSFATFREGLAYVYLPELEKQFGGELRTWQPNVIHIWGTEYGHTLAMVNAAEAAGMLDQCAISIQGLCSVYAGHYAEGVPFEVQKKSTFRDFIRKDNILQQQKKFALRGELEVKALGKIRHVIGRTDWDKACTKRVNPQVQYHFCNETLRTPFYEGKWTYDNCQKHRIFAPSCLYPIKGFHYVMEAFAELLKDYPDATLAVPGKSFLNRDKLRQEGYQKYLAEQAEKLGISGKIEFMGKLSAEEMKQEFLQANVFALPSTIENSPNSLGEAMLLGVPCVAGDVGGVTTLMNHGEDGFVYQSTAAYMLGFYIRQVFEMETEAAKLGEKAREHARRTHDPEKNLGDLLGIYRELARV